MPKITYTKDELDLAEFELTELRLHLKKLASSVEKQLDKEEVTIAVIVIAIVTKYPLTSLGLEFALASCLELIVTNMLDSLPKLRKENNHE